MPEPADTERHLVIDGRRWRKTDPRIPEPLRVQLVSGLMAGRRAVGAGKKAGDDEAISRARLVVHDAKVALGERGEPWWEVASPEGLDARIAATIVALLRSRVAASTICPSEAARVVGANGWRDQMDRVRRVAADLASLRVADVRQSGEVVEAGARGPIRLGRGPAIDKARIRG